MRVEREMMLRALRLALGVGMAIGAAACGPAVGDACETDAACGTGLFCDFSTPGGYCTMSPCRVGECPEEAECIDFGGEAKFCMRKCDDGQGCRDGLTCRTDVGPVAFCGVEPAS